ncbi:hypothetical protein AF42_03459 [Citrobacter freundii MGH 56]|nr:hypothetical protein MC47_009910 [Citrobacter freundii]KDF13357.1 hypothetical protein AF42_03459 [Citrobacter freundii MGH 56]
MHEILWIPFIIASVAIISIPGQDMMLIMTKSISEGIGAGVRTASGVSLGHIIHTLIVSFGLGSLRISVLDNKTGGSGVSFLPGLQPA